MSKRRKYDKQFKIDAVQLHKDSEKTIAEIASNLGISENMLWRWKKELSEGKESSFPGQGNPRDTELAQLRKENANLRMERDILKKALAIFSKPENRNTNS